jgi:hypothetical protein
MRARTVLNRLISMRWISALMGVRLLWILREVEPFSNGDLADLVVVWESRDDLEVKKLLRRQRKNT